ncbi:MAG TPA: hypothetical protein VHZ31_06790 [Solirubrobacteraceae bacterium]|nr:hypothetical protein [Solirubrobacteraceae bacterium]
MIDLRQRCGEIVSASLIDLAHDLDLDGDQQTAARVTMDDVAAAVMRLTAGEVIGVCVELGTAALPRLEELIDMVVRPDLDAELVDLVKTALRHVLTAHCLVIQEGD